MTLHDKFED